MKDIRRELEKQNKKWLIDKLIELAVTDDANADRIMLSLVAVKCDDATIVSKFKAQVDKAAAEIEAHGPGSWRSPLPTSAFDSVADALAGVTSEQMLPAVIETSEYALLTLDRLFELQDECELEYLVDAFRALHLTACLALKPDPSELGARLAELSMQTEWGFFDGPPDGYADVLGAKGLSAFCAKLKVSETRS
jgi:hypothetical protein